MASNKESHKLTGILTKPAQSYPHKRAQSYPGRSVALRSLSLFSASTYRRDRYKPGSVDNPVKQGLAVLDDKRVPQPTGVTSYLHRVGWVKELINNGGSFQDHITIGVEPEVPAVDLEVGFDNQTSLPESLEQNTGSLGDIADLEVGLDNQTSLPESLEQNTGSLGDIADPTSGLNRSNGIWHLRYITACNFVSNATVGVLYLAKNLQGFHETYQRAELIASVAAPIAVAAGSFVASILFASNPGRWSKWISGIAMINAGMTVGGPLSFNWARN